MTLMPLFGKLRCQPEARSTRFSHEKETATPAYYTVSLPDENIYAEMTGRSRSAIFRFTYSKAGKGYLVVNPNSDEGQGYICIDPLTIRFTDIILFTAFIRVGENRQGIADILSFSSKRS